MLDTLTPNFTLIEVTVEQVYNAIKKNGYEHIREMWFEDGGACVLGQGALNLGVAASIDGEEDHINFPDDVDDPHGYENAYELVKKNSLNAQLNRWSVPKHSKWNRGIDVDKIGDAIVYWNDRLEYDDNGEPVEVGGYRQYFLPTYDDVTAMVYALLKPHFAKTVKLVTYDYEAP